MSSELMSFLMPMGWSVDEFSALRTYGVRPPSEISAADLNELAEQNAQVSQKSFYYLSSYLPHPFAI